MMPFNQLRYLWPLLVLWLSGCAVQTKYYSTDSPLWRQHQQQLEQINRYQVRGAFAWIEGKQKLYARFFWRQNTSEDYRLLLTSPLGSTQMDLHVTPDQAQLLDRKGQRHSARSPEQLITELTGMTLPVASLQRWMIGLPEGAGEYTLDQHYRLKTLNYQQDGKLWQVVYSAYDDKSRPALPAEITLSQGELRIKLKMDHWSVQ